MLRLILLRHASTAWARPGKRDIDRQLNDEGIVELVAIRKSIIEHKLVPTRIFCSPAKRTRQTLEGIANCFETKATEFPEILYSGYVQEYLEIIKAAREPETILIVGHNPSCGSLANQLVAKNDPAALDKVSYQFPPGALAVIDFEIGSWSDLMPGTGNLAHFLVP